MATMSFYGCTQDGMVALLDLIPSIPVLLRKPGATLNICKKESNGPAGLHDNTSKTIHKIFRIGCFRIGILERIKGSTPLVNRSNGNFQPLADRTAGFLPCLLELIPNASLLHLILWYLLV
jgi:hypothetical protein